MLGWKINKEEMMPCFALWLYVMNCWAYSKCQMKIRWQIDFTVNVERKRQTLQKRWWYFMHDNPPSHSHKQNAEEKSLLKFLCHLLSDLYIVWKEYISLPKHSFGNCYKCIRNNWPFYHTVLQTNGIRNRSERNANQIP